MSPHSTVEMGNSGRDPGIKRRVPAVPPPKGGNWVGTQNRRSGPFLAGHRDRTLGLHPATEGELVSGRGTGRQDPTMKPRGRLGSGPRDRTLGPHPAVEEGTRAGTPRVGETPVSRHFRKVPVRANRNFSLLGPGAMHSPSSPRSGFSKACPATSVSESDWDRTTDNAGTRSHQCCGG